MGCSSSAWFFSLFAYKWVLNYCRTPPEFADELRRQRFKKTIMTRLRHNFNEHQNDWDAWVQFSTYTYSSQIHCTTNSTLLSLTFFKVLPAPPGKSSASANQLHATRTIPIRLLKDSLLDRCCTMRIRAHLLVQASQAKYKTYADRTVSAQQTFKSGDHVFVNVPPVHVHDADELAIETSKSVKPRRHGPFKAVSF